MLAITGGVRIYLWRGVTDMRKSYDSLAALVQYHMKSDPYDGSLYVFCNRNRNRFPHGAAEKQSVDAGTLAMLLEGIVPARRSVRYCRNT
jgi:transposase